MKLETVNLHIAETPKPLEAEQQTIAFIKMSPVC